MLHDGNKLTATHLLEAKRFLEQNDTLDGLRYGTFNRMSDFEKAMRNIILYGNPVYFVTTPRKSRSFFSDYYTAKPIIFDDPYRETMGYNCYTTTAPTAEKLSEMAEDAKKNEERNERRKALDEKNEAKREAVAASPDMVRSKELSAAQKMLREAEAARKHSAEIANKAVSSTSFDSHSAYLGYVDHEASDESYAICGDAKYAGPTALELKRRAVYGKFTDALKKALGELARDIEAEAAEVISAKA